MTKQRRAARRWSARSAAVAAHGGRCLALTTYASASNACRRGPRQRIRPIRIWRVTSNPRHVS